MKPSHLFKKVLSGLALALALAASTAALAQNPAQTSGATPTQAQSQPPAPTQPAAPAQTRVGVGGDLVAKGEYLARAGDCVACHTTPEGKLFSGGRAMPTPFGTLYTSNITPDPETGIGKWTADDFYKTMHEGRFPDGGLLYPAMPFTSYTKVTREDSDAIFAYLRTIPPVRQADRPHDLQFPYNNRSLILGWRTLFFSEGTFRPDPKQSDEWNRGAYLVEGLGHCGMCHTAINALGGSSESKAFQGGLIPMQNWYAPSLTSNKEAGLGDWSIKDIADLLKSGVSHRGVVYGPMAEVVYNSLQYLSDEDTRAMAVYLKSLAQGTPPEPAASPLPTTESSLLLSLGKTVYDRQCASCHGAEGKGMPPHYPPLAGNQSIQMGSAVNPIRMVLNGGYPPGTSGNPHPYGMPPFAQSLSDNEIAAVVTYIRTSWGNRGAPVSAADANALRSAPLD
ncbi:Cytochrome c, mono-and diheme variants [Faunimonas pinastri]|uniref:Cytochrome c, mono-and diheme variants n=1 Tax=Faunimonas pinastri TaxID=1855383 RepID=A0A1H9II63_9HYPH|nr:cytochrome c [Faunimonas pinastri]SEQ74227.1 Cytochrome c, mono-and diheme variants [Faunimonas pinastri]